MASGRFHKKLCKIRGPLISFLSETIIFCFEIIVKGSIYLRMAFATLPWSTFKIQGMALHGSSALLYQPILLPIKQTTAFLPHFCLFSHYAEPIVRLINHVHLFLFILPAADLYFTLQGYVSKGFGDWCNLPGINLHFV